MYQTIVVPLDGSKLAEVALPYAEEMAAKAGCNVVLLSVLESEEVAEYQKYLGYIKKLVTATKRHAEKYMGEALGKTVNVGTATRRGSPAEAILEYVSKGPFSLIVMATHGRSGVGRWAVGSVADKVVRASTRQPVLLIRAKETRSDVREKRILKKALVPLDGSAGSRAVIPCMREIASKLEMEITLLQVMPNTNHSFSDAERYLQTVVSMFEEKGIKAACEVRVGSPADVIIECADELAIDMVAMSTRGKTSIGPWPLGSVAQKVLLAGNTPLLLVKD